MTTNDFERAAAVFKALGHPSRLMMAKALGQRDMCVCELQALVGSDLSTVSKHLAVMKSAGIVTSFKQGNFVHYRLLRRCVVRFLDCLEQPADSASASSCGCESNACGSESGFDGIEQPAHKREKTNQHAEK